jgi:hypothetical protein
MTREKAYKIAGWLLLAGVPALLIVFVSGALLWWNGWAFQAMSCVPPSKTPVMVVKVETYRKGHIVEHRLLGCTFYSYETSATYSD